VFSATLRTKFHRLLYTPALSLHRARALPYRVPRLS
jgi:hypothetical protein